MSKDTVLDWLELIQTKVREGCPNRSILGAVRGLEEELIWDMGREQQFEARRQIDASTSGPHPGAEKNRLPGCSLLAKPPGAGH
jgi:hypothetical protein